ncbi:MAG: type II toxin-antitoxin system RelE/ParE family toxin [Acidobacteriota bacterium]
MRIDWSDPAVEDLAAIHAYISRDSETYARHFVARLLELVEGLEAFPRRGRRLPEASDYSDVRELVFQGYRIVYRSEDERILILAVIHGSRDINRLEPWRVP